MKKRNYPFSFFIFGFISNILFHFSWLFIPSIILIIIGIFIKECLYLGLALLLINIILSFIEQIRIRHIMLSDSDNEDFQKFQNAVLGDESPIDSVINLVENAIKEHDDNE